MKANKAVINYSDETVSGTTPSGEEFSIPLRFGGKKDEFVAAVTTENSELREQVNQTGQIMSTDKAVCLEPGQGKMMKFTVNRQEWEQGCDASTWLWSPTKLQISTEDCDQGDSTDFVHLEVTDMALLQPVKDKDTGEVSATY